MQKARYYFIIKALTELHIQILGSIFTKYLSSLSSFLRSTSSLSIVNSYLGLEGGPPIFKQGYVSYSTLIYVLFLYLILNYKTFTFSGKPFLTFHLIK